MQVEREREGSMIGTASTLRLPSVEEFQFVRYRIDGEVAHLTLDRPEHNLLNERMLNESPLASISSATTRNQA